jgi:hypothetical protein
MAIGSTSAFRPSGSIGLTVSTIAAATLLPGGGESVLITNPTTALAYIKFGSDNSVTATNADMPILPNSRCLLSVNALITYVSLLLSSGSGTLYATRGDGSFI